ncbi:Isoprenylcysteine carboxyl methyltransferase family-domain-containing protein [Hysterangium stoloniferum]|nr:Isoprenylcysteine carboxyl methyltransferase family-domain-containing protein [Hysterangium stoloniferum]
MVGSVELDDHFEAKIRQHAAATASSNSLETIPEPGQFQPHGNIPNTPLAASLISFLLGGLFTASFITFSLDGLGGYWWTTYQLGFYLAAWSAFHWAEFAVTAGWNREKCTVDSFLLDNGSMYHVAHATALLEYLLTLYFQPSAKTYPYVSQAGECRGSIALLGITNDRKRALGIILTLVGQALRSSAMIHAATNFSHPVALEKQPGHRLVTDGIYGWLRHPSYTGFFYWALGTQLVLQNPFSCIMFAIVLWRFFYARTRREERALERFFGVDYVQYRQRVGTLIPFIP